MNNFYLVITKISTKLSIKSNLIIFMSNDADTNLSVDAAGQTECGESARNRVKGDKRREWAEEQHLEEEESKMIGKKVEVSLRLFDIFERNRVFIFLCGSLGTP